MRIKTNFKSPKIVQSVIILSHDIPIKKRCRACWVLIQANNSITKRCLCLIIVVKHFYPFKKNLCSLKHRFVSWINNERVLISPLPRKPSYHSGGGEERVPDALSNLSSHGATVWKDNVYSWHAEALLTWHKARSMWNIHLYLKLEVNISYRRWLLGIEAMEGALDRSVHLLAVTARVHAEWPAFTCASKNIHLLWNLEWQPCTQISRDSTQRAWLCNNLIIKM